MADASLSSRAPRPRDPRRPTKTSWAHRRPPGDPIERIKFRVNRAHILLLYYVMRDLHLLKTELVGVEIPPAQRREIQRMCRILANSLESARHMARGRRIELRRQRRLESPEMAWLRWQLATLGGAQ
jgi:hypothetical protein